MVLPAGARPASAADLKEKLVPCLGCHGTQGQSAIENVHSPGAQPASYTVIRLFMFREKMRVTEPMNEKWQSNLATTICNRLRT